MTELKPLSVDQLYLACDPDQLGFDSTDEVQDPDEVIGQPRAVEAINFGTRMSGDGYNIFALGSPGTGKFTAVNKILGQEASSRPVPSDWCYVNNFDSPHKPSALELPPGRASGLRRDMDQLTDDLGTAIPAAFESENYQARAQEFENEFTERRDQALEEVGEAARKQNIQLVHTPGGFAFAPYGKDKQVIRPEVFSKLPREEQERVQKTVEQLQKQLQRVIRQMPIWQKEVREKVRQLDREIAQHAVGHLIDVLRDEYRDLDAVLAYLDEVEKDLIENAREFRGEPENPLIQGLGEAQSRSAAMQRYKVNVVVDNAELQSAPVVYEDLPNHSNLVGRIEHRAQMGTLLTDFTLVKGGELHRANGGYLILDARHVLVQPYAWESLKRALRSREVRIESLEKTLSLVSTVSLEPEPIPLDVKVVLIGDRMLYYLLYQLDPEFRDLFKISADFDEQMHRSEESTRLFARTIAGVAQREKLLPLDKTGVARIEEHSARHAGDAGKLSIQLGELTDLLRESDYWARSGGRELISKSHVERAIDAKIFRSDRVRERIYEAISNGTIKIDVGGAKVGQINGLSVIGLAEFSFGQPSRITATARLGDGRVLDIERETELGGALHTKGVMILSNFLGHRYAAEQPLSMSASLVFEQSYGMVEGDSASLAELCTLLSALSGAPIAQSFAVTGSVNQRGEVQAIGGVNQKIEGFFDVCRALGAEEVPQVIIPKSNERHLMLRSDVVEAVREGAFRIWSVDNVDEAMMLLTGPEAGARDEDGEYPADSLNSRVVKRLMEFAMLRQRFSASSDSDEDDTPELIVDG